MKKYSRKFNSFFWLSFSLTFICKGNDSLNVVETFFFGGLLSAQFFFLLTQTRFFFLFQCTKFQQFFCCMTVHNFFLWSPYSFQQQFKIVFSSRHQKTRGFKWKKITGRRKTRKKQPANTKKFRWAKIKKKKELDKNPLEKFEEKWR